MSDLGLLGFPPASACEMTDRPDLVIYITWNCVRRGQMLRDPHVAMLTCSHLLVLLVKDA